jgi:hypothetical protein
VPGGAFASPGKQRLGGLGGLGLGESRPQGQSSTIADPRTQQRGSGGFTEHGFGTEEPRMGGRPAPRRRRPSQEQIAGLLTGNPL